MPVARDHVARWAQAVAVHGAGRVTAIGHHDADKFLPFLLTMFVFVLGCNLVGLLPRAGSATG